MYRTFFHCLPLTDRSFLLLTSLPRHVHTCCLFLFGHTPPAHLAEALSLVPPRYTLTSLAAPSRQLPLSCSEKTAVLGGPPRSPHPTPGERCGTGFMCKEHIPHCNEMLCRHCGKLWRFCFLHLSLRDACIVDDAHSFSFFSCFFLLLFLF